MIHAEIDITLFLLLFFMREHKNMFVFIAKNITCGNVGPGVNLCCHQCVFERLLVGYTFEGTSLYDIMYESFACPCPCLHVIPVCVYVCVCQLLCVHLCVEYDLRILRLIVAVFHIIDSEQRYRQAKRRQLAAAPASGMGL